jgi:MFS family permease
MSNKKCRGDFFLFLKAAVPGAVWCIGVSSLLVNIATSVTFAGTALYLKTVLCVATSDIGIIEAVVEAIAYAVRIFSGVISDYFRNRKTVMMIGFLLVTISKPVLGLSESASGVFVARAIDRLGNGIQATPRDALIGDVSPREWKGACYGLRQSLAVVGSTIGGALGIVVMTFSGNDFQLLFFLAAIPSFIAVMILLFFVREAKEGAIQKRARRRIKLTDLTSLGKKYWTLMATIAIFMLGRFSEVFLSIHACSNFGLDVAYGTLIVIIYNLAAALISYPIGKLSDSINRTTLLLIGFFLSFLSHVTLWTTNSLFLVFVGTVLWGCQVGIVQSISSALISDYVPKELRGTGFGAYYFIVALCTATASVVAGFVSKGFGEAYAFCIGAAFCLMSIVVGLLVRKRLFQSDSSKSS